MALFRWFDSYGHINEMQKLEKTHATMHGVIKEVIGLKNSGQAEKAESQFVAISALSEAIASLPTQVEGKVKAPGAVTKAT